MTGERIGDQAPHPEERRYRPGRGGYDPEAAALAARARYVYRQRVVIGLLATAVLTLVLALTASSAFWWPQVLLDLLLVAYLGYLRRQVRIEEEVRNRRAARLAGYRAGREDDVAARDYAADHAASDDYGPVEYGADHEAPAGAPLDYDPEYDDGGPVDDAPPRPAEPAEPAHPTAVAVEVDDEDPAFAELDPSFEPPYRRAVGE